MNHSNQPNRKQDAQWAEFLESRQTEPTVGSPVENVTPERMEDLRADSMIRKAVEMNRESEFGFADRVVNHLTGATNAEDSLNQLPTPRPAFARTSDDAQPCNDDPLIDTSLATSDCQITPAKIKTLTEPRSAPAWMAWTIALTSAAAGILIAFLAANILDTAPSVADHTPSQPTEAPSRELADTPVVQPPAPSSPASLDSDTVPSKPSPIELVIGNQIGESDSMAQKTTEADAVDSDDKPAIDLAANVPQNAVQQPDKNKLPPIESVVDPTIAKQPVVTQQIALEDCNWVMDIDFNSRGVASAKVNQLDLNQAVFHENLAPVLKNLATDLHRRFAYLEPRLDSKITGAFVVESRPFTFEGSDQVRAAAENAIAYSKTLSFRNLNNTEVDSMHTMFAIQAQINSKLPAMSSLQKAIQSMTNAAPNNQYGFMFATPDEVELVKHVIARTHQVLQDLAIERRDWEEKHQIAPINILDKLDHVPGIDQSIQPLPFDHFVRTGELQLPGLPAYESAKPLIQKQTAEELRQSLSRFTPAFDIFKSKEEADQAARYVMANRSQSSEVQKMEAELRSLNVKMSRFTLKRREQESGAAAFEKVKKEHDQLQAKLRDLKQKPLEPLKEILPLRPDLQGLPLVMGKECRMEEDRAVSMDRASKFVGETLNIFDRFGTRDEKKHDSWRCSILQQQIKACCNLENRTQALSTMDQMLQVDQPRLRTELISALKETGTMSGMELISRRAKFDLVPEVRLAATDALKAFDLEDVRETLLEGLEYPWPIVAMHSAEALVRLNDTEAADDLIELLESPNPREPIQLKSGDYVQRELVAINHMKNCLLCHAPSNNEKDYGRGLTPTWEQPLPQHYYRSRFGAFVRADVTYLRQDFSVMQPVENHGTWPRLQRFDYVIQNKKLTPSEARAQMRALSKEGNPNRQAVVFALQSLTGKKAPRDTKDEWTRIVNQFKREQKSNP